MSQAILREKSDKPIFWATWGPNGQILTIFSHILGTRCHWEKPKILISTKLKTFQVKIRIPKIGEKWDKPIFWSIWLTFNYITHSTCENINIITITRKIQIFWLFKIGLLWTIPHKKSCEARVSRKFKNTK